MQDRERETLKVHATALANLLTENVPYLLGHYLQNGVLTEAEREDIVRQFMLLFHNIYAFLCEYAVNVHNTFVYWFYRFNNNLLKKLR